MPIRLNASIATEPTLTMAVSGSDELRANINGLEVLRGEKGDKGDPGDSFIEFFIYESSTYEEIKASYTAGKIPVVESSARFYSMSYMSRNYIDFCMSDDERIWTIRVTKDNEWLEWSAEVELSGRKVQTLDNSETHYPSTKAVGDAIANKQDTISDLATIRSGAAKGATALQSYTETDPTVPSWAKAAIKPAYTASEVGALPADTDIPPQQFFIINEDDCTIETDATKGVAPYSTSYGYTNVTIDPDAGISWVEGAWYTFVINTKLIVASANRNVRVRIGEDDAWHPVMGYTTSILGGSSYFVKAMTVVFQYKSTMRAEGALHLNYDANTTYAYLVNTVIGDATSSPIVIDSTGYGARYSLIFPTTADRAKWSSLVKSSSTGTTKAATPCTFYAQDPMYIYSANVAAGAKPINSVYQYYQATDLRYTANTSSTYLPAYDRAFLWLKDFNPDDKTFKADATVGNVVGGTKLGTRWATSVTGDIYLYWLGYTTATWYQLNPLQVDCPRIWKYTPSTGMLVPWDELADRLGVIENGTY